MKNIEIELCKISEIIDNSWGRCLTRGLNAYAPVEDLIRYRESYLDHQMQLLISLMAPFVDYLYNFNKGSNFFILADNEGIILEIYGSPVITQKIKHLGLEKGADWSESAVGTNAIGLAIIEKSPQQVFRTEHYCHIFHSLDGSAAPFFGPNKELLGVLVLLGINQDVHPYSLGMVEAAAQMIENQILYNMSIINLVLANEQSRTIMDTISEGLIYVNKEGLIVDLNSASGKMLDLDPKNCISRPAEEVFGERFFLLDALKKGKAVTGLEVEWECGTGRRMFILNCKPYIGNDGIAKGMIATLRENNTVRQRVNSMVGARAGITFDDIIGSDEKIIAVIEKAKKIARSGSTVLIEGESGTGKELFTQAIHNYSSRSNRPFVVVNCAAIPRELVESELFGYEDGAFTGARRGGRPGKFELANGGTIFLDEIGDMPLEIQASLLRVLQEKQVNRIGSERVIHVNTRVIAATHRNLRKEVEKGNFRLDLYYRLNVIAITIPSLRDRLECIPVLANHFKNKICDSIGLADLDISAEFIQALQCYSWPGNVRELENVIEQSLYLVEGNRLLPEHLPVRMNWKKAAPQTFGRGSSIRQHEEDLIRDTLTICNGNVSKAAKILGIGRNTLYRKQRQYDINL